MIQASSTEAEKNFSKVGGLVTSKRTRLSSGLLEALVLIASHITIKNK